MDYKLPSVREMIKDACEHTGLDFDKLWQGNNQGLPKLSIIIKGMGYDPDKAVTKTAKGKRQCWTCIADGFRQYLRSYPASRKYKQKEYESLMKCLHHIQEKYQLVSADEVGDALTAPLSEDTTAALLKCLHNRSGVTIRRLTRVLRKSRPAVLEDLKRLDPKLASKEMDPLQFAGQDVFANIETWKNGSERAIRYCTPETIHPLAMLLNLSQVGTLLQSLYDSYSKRESQICYRLALNVWLQLSEYCRNRVAFVFGSKDKGFQEFLNELQCDADSGEMQVGFLSEPEMIQDGFVNRREEFAAAIKGGSHCRIILPDSRGWIDSAQIRMLGPTLFEAEIPDEESEQMRTVEFSADAVKKFEYLDA